MMETRIETVIVELKIAVRSDDEINFLKADAKTAAGRYRCRTIHFPGKLWEYLGVELGQDGCNEWVVLYKRALALERETERPTVPSRKSATLPKGLDKVQRHKDAEKNIV